MLVSELAVDTALSRLRRGHMKAAPTQQLRPPGLLTVVAMEHQHQEVELSVHSEEKEEAMAAHTRGSETCKMDSLMF